MNERTYIDPRVDRSKWPAGPWDDEPDKVQWVDDETGFACLAKRHARSGHWCGYVGVPPGHPWVGTNWDTCHANVHGGVTYGDHCQEGPEAETVCHIPEPGTPDHLYWIGFDCAHSGDRSPQDEARALERGYPWTTTPGYDETYKTLNYVRLECRGLAAQARDATRT